jgi:galactokinase
MEPAGLPPPADPERLAAWFSDCFGAPPTLIWHAPGRVNLIGEHTDYNDGLVLPFALGRGVLAAVAGRPDRSLEIRSLQVPGDVVHIPLDRLRPGTVTGWSAYVAGAAWALQTAGGHVGGVNVAVDADLPIGAGLSSSAALTCSVVSCLAALAGRADLSRPMVAALARRAETDFVGMPCGIMDQSAAMLCQAGQALLLDCRTGESAAVPLDPGEQGLGLLVIDTGVRHELADGQYALRQLQCQQAASLIGVSSLRDVRDVRQLADLTDPVLVRRARHVVTENQRVGRVAGLLRAGRMSECGTLLTQSHVSLRDDFEVSWPAADRVVDAAVAAGALGARMTGGGFGGCVITLLPARRVRPVTVAVSAALAGFTPAPPAFLIARPADGAHPAWPAAMAAGSRPG